MHSIKLYGFCFITCPMNSNKIWQKLIHIPNLSCLCSVNHFIIFQYPQFRQQYKVWKSECQTMVPVIGTGNFLTSPLIDNDELPIDQSLIGVPVSDKRTLRWMQTLHQIGMLMSIITCFNIFILLQFFVF